MKNADNFPVREVLDFLAHRQSCRAFDGSDIDPELLKEIVSDGTEAPSSCNQQHWHFVVVTDRDLLREAARIAGGNPHFADCGALIYLCFQKGWAHRNLSVVQSVAAAGYHMILSAHLRGFSTIWNAGIGPEAALRRMLGIPPLFEIQAAIAIGRARPDAPRRKAPRRPSQEVMSFNRFARPAHSIYPARPDAAYPMARIGNDDNPFAEWDPTRWSWAQLADFRAYTVWAKSPLAGVYRSQRNGEAFEADMALWPAWPTAPRVAELMAWGGTSTAALRRALPADARVEVVELSAHNLDFIRARLDAEGLGGLPTGYHEWSGGRLPFGDGALDAVYLPQVLEQMPTRGPVLDEVRRVLRPGGVVLASSRNMTSRYGRLWRTEDCRGQVPLQGPFTPLPARQIEALIASRFAVTEAVGFGAAATHDTAPARGWARRRRRILALLGRRA